MQAYIAHIKEEEEIINKEYQKQYFYLEDARNRVLSLNDSIVNLYYDNLDDEVKEKYLKWKLLEKDICKAIIPRRCAASTRYDMQQAIVTVYNHMISKRLYPFISHWNVDQLVDDYYNGNEKYMTFMHNWEF